MIFSFTLRVVFGIGLYLISLFIKDDGFIKSTSAFIGGALVGISIIMIINSHEPIVIDFMRGKVDVSIQETYVDSVLIKRDTVITYK